jgi:hypothetical protein
MEMTLTAALALLVVSATLVAVTVCPAAAAGAVYNPLLLTVPTVVLPPAMPSTDQVTAVLSLPVTVGVNCCVPPAPTVAVVGAMVMVSTGGGPTGFTVTAALAVLLVSAVATAVTVICKETSVVGAVYKPELETVPVWLVPPATLLTFQVTLVLLEPLTVAWNC